MNATFHTTKYLANNNTTLSPKKRKREQMDINASNHVTTPSLSSTPTSNITNSIISIFKKKPIKNVNTSEIEEKENTENTTNQPHHQFSVPESVNKRRKMTENDAHSNSTLELKPKPDENCSPSDYKLPAPDFITSSPVNTSCTPKYSFRQRTTENNVTPIRSPTKLQNSVTNNDHTTPITPRSNRLLAAISSLHSPTSSSSSSSSQTPSKPKILETIFSPVFNYFQKKEEKTKSHELLAPTEDLTNAADDDEDYNFHLQITHSEELSWSYTSDESESESSSSVSLLYEEEDDVIVNFPFQYDSLIFMKCLSPVDSFHRKVHLPAKNDEKITLVLDLDETLVHCSTQYLGDSDHVFPVEFGGVEYTVYARKRPYLYEFLSYVKKLFEVVIFTASQKVYADCILDLIEEDEKYIDHRLYRDSCVYTSGNYLKDLRILGRDLSKVVIIDNSITVFGYQVNNGVPITSWYEDRNDEELMTLLPFLESIAASKDVRPLIERRYRLQECINNVSQEDYFDDLSDDDDDLI